MMIQAIETIYKGYRFRSRLEARWAIFFDALSLKWEYEREGFDLNSVNLAACSRQDDSGLLSGNQDIGPLADGWYLPDFWLPDMDTHGAWVEIKPSLTGDPVGEWCDDPKWWRHALLLAIDETSDIHTYCIVGEPPDPDSVSVGGAQNITVMGDANYSFCVCPQCGKIGIEFDGRSGRIPCPCPVHEKEYTGNHPRILQAYKAARQSRFEHGEKGR